MKKPMWIWYYGDFEIYHNLKMSMRRKQYGAFLPAFWRVSDCNRCVRFRKTVTLTAPEKVTFIADGQMNVQLNSENYAGTSLFLEKGTHTIVVGVYNPTGIPALFVSGKTVVSDETWEADCVMTLYGADYKPVGYWNLFDKKVTPTAFTLPAKKMIPTTLSQKKKEVILDFGKEVNIKLFISASGTPQSLKIYYGESLPEVKSNDFCVLSDNVTITDEDYLSELRGCRYVRISGNLTGEVCGFCEYLPKKPVGKFKSNNKLLNDIYKTSEYTYDITSNLFFIDGIKRDGWIWGGDAYQSILFDFYYCFDKDIVKRTLIALRGKDPVTSHINGIADYTFYWIISASAYYMYTGDIEFIRNIYDSIKTLVTYCNKNIDKDGFFVGDENDWIFVDWADTEKEGAVSSLQMLYAKAMLEFANLSKALGSTEDYEKYNAVYEDLKIKINRLYWNDSLGGYITTIINGKAINNITRHANIFAVIFDIATDIQKERILKNVLLNDSIPRIRTPFFSFFEYDALGKLKQFDTLKTRIEEYWGGMLVEGTGTFWEEYDPRETGIEKYSMYGRPFERSLCHAWGASPLYLIGRYFAGIIPLKPGYEEFEITPALCGLDNFTMTVPVNSGFVKISAKENTLNVFSTIDGGFVLYNDERVKIEADKEYSFLRWN